MVRNPVEGSVERKKKMGGLHYSQTSAEGQSDRQTAVMNDWQELELPIKLFPS